MKGVSKAWRKDIPLTLQHWHLSSEEPLWQYRIRQAFYKLKEAGLIVGREYGGWSLATDTCSTYDSLASERGKHTSTRIMRDSEIVRELKLLYDHQCQVCGMALNLPGQLYVEAHHIRPLGNPHYGPDSKDNLIILCPNHHVYFDYAAMALNPKTGLVELLRSGGKMNVGPLKHHYHNFSKECLRYHYSMFLSNLH